jgi:hypothetical protein
MSSNWWNAEAGEIWYSGGEQAQGAANRELVEADGRAALSNE